MRSFIDYMLHYKDNPKFNEIKRHEIHDSLRISIIVCSAAFAAVLIFIVSLYLWPESYKTEELLKGYRTVYLAILGGLFIYEIIVLFINRNYTKHYKKVPIINTIALFIILWCTLEIIGLDYRLFGRVDSTLFVIVSICIPFCLYLDYRVYLLFTVASDIFMVWFYIRNGVDAAFNESNLADFLLFIGVQLIVGSTIYCFKYTMYKRIIEGKSQQEEIRQLNQAQNRFFSNMSHEIRTPINTIIGLNEMILRQNASDEINEDAENIRSASKMLLHLINDILDMSKIESGQMKLNYAPYHTGDMLSDIVGMLWIRAKDKNLDFKVDVSPELPAELYGDEVRIKQVLINVLNNAIKYTSEGAVTLSIQCVRDGEGNANVVYAVNDTGMGIKKESIPYLFTAFKRVDEDKNRYIEGTGLGLSIVKQFVDLMNGKISVNSVYTKGSTFIIEIPQKIINDDYIGEFDAEKRHKDKEGYKYVESFEAPKAKVLVVDDTEANLMVVTKLLKETKVMIHTATSGEEALRMTLEEAYHVILMDHKMPGMDGIECMHAIRKQQGGLSREAKVIALTANGGSEAEALYDREGFDGYLMKPVTGVELEAALYRQLPAKLVNVTGMAERKDDESIAWISSHKKKVAVKITTESVADVPRALVDKYDIAVLPHMVRTDDGLFKDGLEIETGGLLTYMKNEDAYVETVPPTVEEHENFFSKQLDYANNIIHVSISSKVEHSGCIMSMAAADNFDNVTVVDSGHLSSGQGHIVVEAARLAQEGYSAQEIAERLKVMKDHVYTSFIVDSLDFLRRQGQVSSRVANIAKAFMVHPVLSLKKGVMGVSKVYFGSRSRAVDKYIAHAFKVPGVIDQRILFITYVGMTTKELEEVQNKVEELYQFKEVYFQKASPAIAANSGPGTFGLLFFTEY